MQLARHFLRALDQLRVRLDAFSAEYANVLRQVERQGNTLSTVLRSAWETGALASLTSGRRESCVRARAALA